MQKFSPQRRKERKGRVFASVCALCVFAVISLPAQAAEEIVSLPSPWTKATQAVLVITPEPPPSIAVLLLVGGGGRVNIDRKPASYRGQNFLYRSADLFAAEGFLTAVVDAPSDHSSLWNLRDTADHAADLEEVIRFLHQRGASKVWLVGTSMGTVSAAAAAARLTEGGPDGIVLTSSVVEMSSQSSESVLTVDLKSIRVPVLMVRHQLDGCRASPPDGADRILARLDNVPVKAVQTYKGGSQPKSPPCEPLAEHGFYGIEDKVVAGISGWIKDPKP